MKQHPENHVSQYSSFFEVLRSRASDRPDERVFSFQSYTGGSCRNAYLTVGGLERRALALAARLQQLGLEGERAVLLFPPGLEFISAFFGCLAAGVIAVPAPAPRPRRPPERIRAILHDAEPRAILTTAAFAAERPRWSGSVAELDELTWLASDQVAGDEDEEATLASRWRDPGLTRETLAFLQYTSGSTITPRGVMISHGNLFYNSAMIQRTFRSTPGTRAVFWLPLYHDMGLIGGVLQVIYCGCSCTMFSPVAFLQDPYRWLETITATGATISGGPNFAYDLCARKLSDEQRSRLDLSSWTVAFNGAEPVRAETLDRFAERFAACGFRREAFLPCYGLAEATLLVSGRPDMAPPVMLPVAAAAIEQNQILPAPATGPGTRTLVGSGRVVAGQEVLIVDPATRVRCADSVVGEIWVSGPSVAGGYWNQPELSTECFAAMLAEPEPEAGVKSGVARNGDSHRGHHEPLSLHPARPVRFLRTGDLGFLRDGELFVTGRLKDLLIIAGRNVYPQDIEALVERSHPLLRYDSGAAVAVEQGGEERLVVVHEVERQTRQDRVEEIAAAVRQALAAEHELEVFAVVLIKAASIPRTSSGKIRRQACKAAFLAGTLDVVGASVRSVPGLDRAPVAQEGESAPAQALPLPETTAEIEAWLTTRLGESLGVVTTAIDRHRPFAQLGLGSQRAVALAGELQERFGRPLSPTLIYEYPTIADLAGFLAGDGPVAVPGNSEMSGIGSTALAGEPSIAVIGIGCRFPGADGPEAFWTLLRDERDAVGELPAARHGHSELTPGDRGGFLERVDEFDADFFGLSPREAVPMDPQQRLLLEVAWEALEDAGQAPERLAGSATGVFVGIATNDYASLGVPNDQPGEVYRITGNASSIAANRISYLFDFRGPSLAIDTACSSSLVAVHLACQSLRSGESMIALAGGVNLILASAIGESFRQAGMLAPDGRCKTFDARADGYVRGEGAGVVVLKPLARALADGDPIYAVIRGSAVNQDGRSNGLTAPSRQSQEAVVRTAFRQAGIAPSRIGYVEAHGTGTLLGDPIEAKALGTVLAEGRPAGRRCLVGSVKTNIGHLEAAAGIAGLIKTALSLKHQAIPAHLHFNQPNPEIPLDELPLEVPRSLVSLAGVGPIVAGVSSFGFGGTNAHVVLEGVVGPASGSEASNGAGADGSHDYLLPISARQPEALMVLARRYREVLTNGLPSAGLGTIVMSAAARRGHHEYRLALVGRSRADWIAQLDAFDRGDLHSGLFIGRAFGGRHPELAAALAGCGFPVQNDGKIIPSLGSGVQERREQIESLAVLYTKGALIAWERLEPAAGFVRLPTYPWQRKRFWWEMSRPGRAPAVPPPRLESVAPRSTQAAPPPDIDSLRALSPANRRARMVSYIENRLALVLQSAPDAIDPERPLDECGIDSLMAMDLKLEIEKDFAIAIPLTSLLIGPTITELAEEVAELIGNHSPESREAVAVDAQEAATALVPSAAEPEFVDHPLSYGQQSLWSLHQLAPESAAYHMAGAARAPRELDAGVLAACFQALTDRHAALRTTFPEVDGRPVQRVHDVGMVTVDFRTEDVFDFVDEAGLTSLLGAEAQRPFDLEQGPLFRARLVRRTGADPVLLLVFHHIIGDFWSVAVLLEELGRLYPAIRSGAEIGLAPLPLQAADFARRQALRLAGADGERLWAYWEKQLAGSLPALDFPTFRPRPAVRSDRGASRSLLIDRDLTERLAALSRAQGVSLYTTLLAALQVLLHRVTGQDDVIVGSPVAGRNQPGCAGVVGYFVNTLPMRGDLSGNPAFVTFLDQIRKTLHAGLEHQDFPFPLMVERLNQPRDPGRSPVFQVLFVFQKAQRGAARELTALTLPEPGPRIDLGGLALELRPLALGTAQFDLTLVGAEQDERLAFGLTYSTDLFDAATIERFLAQFLTLLQAIVAEPERAIDALKIVPAAEHRWLFSASQAAPAEDSVVESIARLFEIQVVKSPDAAAVAFGERAWSYAALNARANRLGRHLRALGIGPEARVGLCVERSLEMIVGMLGILKAGGVYIPLDPGYPEERLGFLIQDAGIDVLLTQEVLQGRFAGRVDRIVCLDAGGDAAAIADQGDDNLDAVRGGDALAYVIYTSGSTGNPKGVMVSNRNLVHSTLARRLFYDEPVSGFLLLSSFAFDSSVAGIFGTLCQGGTLVLPPPAAEHDLARLGRQIESKRVSHLLCVPSLYGLLLAEAPAAQLRGLRVAIVAGEPCGSSLAARHHTVLPHAAFVNEYGPTEATVWCTAHRCLPDERGIETEPRALVPIGRPIAGARIHVLDAWLAPVPIGVAGELFVGGAGVARGYVGRPGLTAERFIPDPFGAEPGSRLYRTGDLARWRDDGTLEFLGRIDNQVKIRGFRIEPGEVEAVLTQHPAIREAAVVAHGELAGAVRLVAYITTTAVTDGQSPIPEWRRWLRERLPDYMVPGAVVVLDRLPFLPNGKIDRRALPDPGASRPEGEHALVPPRGPIEEAVAAVWAEVLRQPMARIGIHDSFFELGGHSLLATQLVSRFRNLFGVEMPLRAVLEDPTVAALGAWIESARCAGEGLRLPSLVAAERPDEVPPSFAQQALWFLDKLAPGQATFNMPVAVRLKGPLDVDAFDRSLAEIVRRHEALRTTFVEVDGRPFQVVAPELTVPVTIEDLHALIPSRREAAVRRLAAAAARFPFDLARGPLIRAQVLRLGAEEHVILLTMHHIIGDGWSFGVAVDELAALYDAQRRGVPSPLAPLPIQYADYALWQRGWLHDAVRDRLVEYWLCQLAGVTPLELPVDRARQPIRTSRGAIYAFTIPAAVAGPLTALCHREGVTPFMLLLAAFQTLLHRYSGQDDIVVGSPVANRTRSEVEGLIGYFVNMLALRTDLSGDPGFRTLLGRVREVALGAYEHQDLPFEMVVEALRPPHDPSRTPIFSVMFVLQNNRIPDVGRFGLELTPLTFPDSMGTGTAKFDLTLSLEESASGFSGGLEYNTDLFDTATIERMTGHFQTLLESIAANPDGRLSELAWLGAAERTLVLETWSAAQESGTIAPATGQGIHHRFEAQVERTPNAPALVFGAERLTYRELNARANRLAWRLTGLGVGPETVVGVCAARSPAMIVGLLGVLKAGGAYMPLDPDLPGGRLSALLDESGVGMVLAPDHLRASVPAGPLAVVPLEDGEDEGEEETERCCTNPPAVVGPGNLAYVIYTSGSTGRPKGVMVEHGSLVEAARAWEQCYELVPGMRHLQAAGFGFDVFAGDWIRALTTGGTLVSCPREALLDPGALAARLREERVDCVELVPAVAEALASELERTGGTLAPLRLLVVGSDTLQSDLFTRLLRLAGPAGRVLNSYGLTEATIDSTYYEEPSNETASSVAGAAPIGRPFGGARVYVLGQRLEPLPMGVTGELYIGGSGVARGYFGRPGITAARFVPDPFGAPGARLYRTGDRGRWRKDGVLELLGRSDHQVKVRGVRIELGEVEAALRRHPAVREVVVEPREDTRGNKRLVAYVVPQSAAERGLEGLRRWLQQTLPEPMIPSAFVLLERLPLAAGGKVDRGALPDPGPSPFEAGAQYVAPRTPLEETLARVWAEVLELERVGVHDSFFDLGGHSLQSVQLVARLTAALRRPVSVKTVFLAPTVASMAEVLDREPAASSDGGHVRVAGPAYRNGHGHENGNGARGEARAALVRWLDETAPGATPPHVTVEDRPLEALFSASSIAPVDSVALGYFPSSLLQFTGLDAATVIRDWCGNRPFCAGVRETPLGRIGLVLIPRFDDQLYQDRSDLLAVLGDAMRLARQSGAATVSLTGLLPSTTDYGRALVEKLAGQDVPRVTTGHATTTAAVVLAVGRALEEAGRTLAGEHVGFVGLGSVGIATLRLLLACLPHPTALSLCDVYSKQEHLEALRQKVTDTMGFRGEVHLIASRHEVPADLYEASLIIGATNVAEILDVDLLAPGTIVVDDSAPHLLPAERALERFRERRDILVTEGGVLAAPGPLPLRVNAPTGLEPRLKAGLVSLVARNQPREIMGCVLSSLLSARFRHLEPTIGMIGRRTALDHYKTLGELGFKAAGLHLDDTRLDEALVHEFRLQYGREHKNGQAHHVSQY
jgi:amino acid adenylation domain-containing protein